MEIRHLGAEVNNIKIWESFSFSQFTFIFLNSLQTALVSLSRARKNDYANPYKIENS